MVEDLLQGKDLTATAITKCQGQEPTKRCAEITRCTPESISCSDPKATRISPPHLKHAQVVALTYIRAAEGNAPHSTRRTTCPRKLDILPGCVVGSMPDSPLPNLSHSPKHPLRLCTSTEIGQKLLICNLSPPLKTGVILACFHCVGTLPVKIEWLIIFAMDGPIA